MLDVRSSVSEYVSELVVVNKPGRGLHSLVFLTLKTQIVFLDNLKAPLF